MFEVDFKGLQELEGGREPSRLAFEPVSNVFDEARGYGGDAERRKPTFCYVDLVQHVTGRGYWLNVNDDGAGFHDERDIWTLFRATPKRSEPGVSGRFNAGDKQLIAASREAIVESGSVRVHFADGKRRRSTVNRLNGCSIKALMPWSKADADAVRRELRCAIPPDGLDYRVDASPVERPELICSARVTLPTVKLADGVLSPTTRQTTVEVFADRYGDSPRLFELGIPICDLAELGFPLSLNVGQKIPVPPTRDVVSSAYLARLIGSTIEAAAMDGKRLLTDEQQGAPFVQMALDWVREPEALKVAVEHLYGADAVRMSTDPIANAQAIATGVSIIPGRYFTPATRRRLDDAKAMPTASQRFPGSAALAADAAAAMDAMEGTKVCDKCGGIGRVRK